MTGQLLPDFSARFMADSPGVTCTRLADRPFSRSRAFQGHFRPGFRPFPAPAFLTLPLVLSTCPRAAMPSPRGAAAPPWGAVSAARPDAAVPAPSLGTWLVWSWALSGVHALRTPQLLPRL